MTPLFLDHFPRKNPVRENQCNYLRVFLIKQYQSTIWVPKLAYQTKNFLSSYTSQFERNLLAETSENPSGSSSAQNCSTAPASAQSGLCQTLSVSCWPCVRLSWLVSTPGGPALAFRASASDMLASGALHNTWLPLHEPLLTLCHSPWLLRCSLGTISAFSVSLYSMPLNCSPDR